MGRESLVPALLLGGLFVAMAEGCANVEAPPGTGPDFEAPSVVERYPAPGSIVSGLDGDAWIRFDEPVQSPRNLERGLDLSPAWEWKFSPRTSGFAVRPREGWREGVVYRIRIPAGVADLIRNRTQQVIEWTFSTGPEISETRIDGIVYDRVTVTGTRDARLLFLSADSVPYSVVSDTGGVYGMRSLPPADYTVFAFMDQNRNRRLDPRSEPWDSASVSLPESDSRYAIDLWMVPPDSTPPRLVSVVAFDTVTLALEFDEPLDPEASLDEAVVTVQGPAGRAPYVVSRMQVGQPGSVLQGDSEGGVESDTTALSDSLAAPDLESPPGAAAGDSTERALAEVSADSLPTPISLSDSLVAEAMAAPDSQVRGMGRLQSAELRARPFPTLVVRLEQPLTEDTFRVTATGVPNLRGLPGGGDTTFVYVAPLPAVAPGAELDSIGGVDRGLEEMLPERQGEAVRREPDDSGESTDATAPVPGGDSTTVPAPERPARQRELRTPPDGDG